MNRRHTIVIGTWSSKCGACGRDADPHAATHDRTIGYTPGPGCGERFVFIDTDYYGMGRVARDMRPDLAPWPGGICEAEGAA